MKTSNEVKVARQSGAARFITTRWSEVLAARGKSAEAQQSLRQLCDQYYAPVYAFVNSYTHYDQNARDWTHEFFAKLLEGQSLDNLCRARGRFRSYLLGAVKHFLSDERAMALSEKRGGLAQHVPLDVIENESSSKCVSVMPTDAYFDRQWAISILDQGLKQLENEATGSLPNGDGKARLFASLRPWLSGNPIEQSQLEIATSLGVSAEVVKVSLHRWRKRFRQIVRTQVAATVDSPEEVEEELRYLVLALRDGVMERRSDGAVE